MSSTRRQQTTTARQHSAFISAMRASLATITACFSWITRNCLTPLYRLALNAIPPRLAPTTLLAAQSQLAAPRSDVALQLAHGIDCRCYFTDNFFLKATPTSNIEGHFDFRSVEQLERDYPEVRSPRSHVPRAPRTDPWLLGARSCSPRWRPAPRTSCSAASPPTPATGGTPRAPLPLGASASPPSTSGCTRRCGRCRRSSSTRRSSRWCAPPSAAPPPPTRRARRWCASAAASTRCPSSRAASVSCCVRSWRTLRGAGCPSAGPTR